MNIHDAAKVLNLTGNITPAIVKQAYREAVKKYHPDINPAGLEMMKLVNGAFATLKDRTEPLNETFSDPAQQDYPEELNEALNAIIGLEGLILEICGAWLWVSGDTKTHKESLKTAGLKWAPKKKQWFFRPAGFRSQNREEHSMEDIRAKYGSSRPKMRTRRALRGAAA